MNLEENPTYYDVLDIKPDATPQEIREAYLRVKSTYNRDSLALYTLVSPEEREQILRKIEEAYEVLSSPDKRRQYDLNYGVLDFDNDLRPLAHLKGQKHIISIDRVPPMEPVSEEDMLIAPSTDIGDMKTGEIRAQPHAAANSAANARRGHFAQDSDSIVSPAQEAMTSSNVVLNTAPEKSMHTPRVSVEHGILQEIALETEFKGAFFKKIRETRHISIEEMSSITKISKTYITALEDDAFQKLPAAVFVRGFVTQLSKALKIPAEKAVSSYMARCNQNRPDKK